VGILEKKNRLISKLQTSKYNTNTEEKYTYYNEWHLLHISAYEQSMLIIMLTQRTKKNTNLSNKYPPENVANFKAIRK
jgi:hypothetical protein